MAEKPTKIQAKYLLTWQKLSGRQRSFANLALLHGVSKSTVQRTLNVLVGRGIVDESYELTEEGRDYLDWYRPRFQSLTDWLMLHEIDKKTAEETAHTWMADTDESVIEMLMRDCMVCNICRNAAGGNGKEAILDGIDLADFLPEGNYDVQLKVLRDEEESERDNEKGELSMADKAFERPVRLIVNDGKSFIQMKRLRIFQISMGSKELMSGKMRTMEYTAQGRNRKPKLDGDFVRIPTRDIKWYCSRNQVLLEGYLRVHFTCTAGSFHMPRRSAILFVQVT